MKGKTKKPEHTSWGDRRQVARKRASTALRQRIVHRWWMFCQHRRIMHVGPYLCTAGMPKVFPLPYESYCTLVSACKIVRIQPTVEDLLRRPSVTPLELQAASSGAHRIHCTARGAKQWFSGCKPASFHTNVRPADRDDVPDERDDRDVSDLAVHGRSRSTGERTPPAMDYTLAECSARKPKPPFVLLIVRFSSIAPSVRHCTA